MKVALVEQERCACGWALFDGECDCRPPAWAKGGLDLDGVIVVPDDRPLHGRVPNVT